MGKGGLAMGTLTPTTSTTVSRVIELAKLESREYICMDWQTNACMLTGGLHRVNRDAVHVWFCNLTGI
jgi:hypothetical protein